MENGQELGRQYVAKLQSFLSSAIELPLSGGDGTLNLAELSRLTGIPRSSFYQNPPLASLLTEALNDRGVLRRGVTKNESERGDAEASDRFDFQRGRQTLERKVHQLEQQLAVVVAENASLRLEIKSVRLQLGREDMMIETGRRVASVDRL